MFRKNIFVVLLVVLLLGAFAYLYLSKTYPQTSPILTGTYYLERMLTPHANLNKHVMGFLPYWQLDSAHTIKPGLLSEINYFSLNVNADGEIKKVVNGETDPGWNGWQKEEVKNLMTKSKIYGTEFTVTIAALDNDLIETILNSPTAQTTLTSQIVDLIKTSNLDGVNIDFEYVGTPDELHRVAFSEFSKKLAEKLKTEAPGTKLSLSLMPLSARPKTAGGDDRVTDLFKFPQLAPIYDYFIGMSYDFYGQNSDIAGPVAPMTGFKENKYFFDVETMYEDFAAVLPKEKILMGVPYYGWDRAVTDSKVINSTTLPEPDRYAAVISYARARDEKTTLKNCQWDDYALETWCRYTDAQNIDHQVWIADNRSIQTRFDYANSQNLGGIGIWVLGYDQRYADLWEMIGKKFIK